MRIVDLETKSLNSPRPAPTTSRRLESRIEELTSQLSQSSKDSMRIHRTADKTARDTKYQLAEVERQRTRLEEEVKSYEAKVVTMRQSMDELVRVIVVMSPFVISHIFDSKRRRTISNLPSGAPNARLRIISRKL